MPWRPVRERDGAARLGPGPGAAAGGQPLQFSGPLGHIADYASDHLGLVAIEESYLANTTNTFAEMPDELSSYQRTDGRCDPAPARPAGRGCIGLLGRRANDRLDRPRSRRLDRREPPAAANLSDLGCHCALDGPRRAGKLRSLPPATTEWSWGRRSTRTSTTSITCSGTARSGTATFRTRARRMRSARRIRARSSSPAPVLPAASATAQPCGRATSPRTSTLLATHMNAQMHMSMSGIDYYGADIGGFRRETMPYNDRQGSYRGYQDELYTQWLANGAWFDVPVRPHTDNEFVVVHAALRHRAASRGRRREQPRQPPSALRADPVLLLTCLPGPPRRRARRTAAGIPLPGRSVRPPDRARETDRPRHPCRRSSPGTANTSATSICQPAAGRTITATSGSRARATSSRTSRSTATAIFRLPAFVRAGAILPKMPVDATTQGRVRPPPRMAASTPPLSFGSTLTDAPSSFTLYEDDGATLLYDADGPAAVPPPANRSRAAVAAG